MFNPETATRAELIDRLELIVNRTDPSMWLAVPSIAHVGPFGPGSMFGCLLQRLFNTTAYSPGALTEKAAGRFSRWEVWCITGLSDNHHRQGARFLLDAMRAQRFEGEGEPSPARIAAWLARLLTSEQPALAAAA